MSHHARKGRAKSSCWRILGHLLGLVILGVLVAATVAVLQMQTGNQQHPTRIPRPSDAQTESVTPIMVKTPETSLAKFYPHQIPLPPLPGIPKNAFDGDVGATLVQVGTKDGYLVYQVTFDSTSSQALTLNNIYLVSIPAAINGVSVPTCQMDNDFNSLFSSTNYYGYRYELPDGSVERAAIEVDVNDDSVPDLPYNQIFSGDFFASGPALASNAGSFAQFQADYAVTFNPTSGEQTGPSQLYAFVVNDPTSTFDPICVAHCGNGSVESPEVCDPNTGITSSAGQANSATSSCTQFCLMPTCGDTIITGPDEECDDGNAVDSDSCVDCLTAYCGDGYLQSVVEQCDDGNGASGDGCYNCALESGFDDYLSPGNWPDNYADTTCNDGIKAGLEQCDLGLTNGNADTCCNSDCTLASAGYECRGAAGTCDAPDTCAATVAGECPSDQYYDNTHECRAADGVCDVADYCNGSSVDCPADAVEADTVACRTTTGECDVTEYCDGAAKTCPAESYSANASSCADDSNECTTDLCNNNVCVHDAVTDYTSCTDNDGNACTNAMCITGACLDLNVADQTSCGDNIDDVCYSGTCEVCGDNVRGHYEDCDNGNSSGCSTNCTVDSGWSCTGDIGSPSVCTDNCVPGNSCTDTDNNECTQATCDSGHSCSQAAAASAGTSCTDDGEWCTYDECNGAGTCAHSSLVADGTPCPTVVDGFCYNGVCQDTCGDGSTQAWEDCDLGGATNGTAGACCTATCTFVTMNTECRAADGICDVAEVCTGASATCPSDAVASNSSVCRTSVSECDSAEYCDGSTKTCPSESYSYNGNACTTDSNECTTDVCSDNSCTHPSVIDNTSCSTNDGNECTASLCESGTCSNVNVPDQTACGDYVNDYCYTGTCEVCGDGVRGHYEDCDNGNSSGCSTNCQVDSGWSCTGNVGSPSVCTDNCVNGAACTDLDGNECTTATCNNVHTCDQGAATSVGTSCTTDGNECTTDECNGLGACSHTSVADGTSCITVLNGHCYTGTCQNTCGDGSVQAWEQCDQGVSNGTTGSCCDTSCNYVTMGTECRASGGVCDVAEACTGSSGSCPSDGVAINSSVCRTSTGECDSPEYCDGVSSACPVESYSYNSSSCTGDGYECTNDYCVDNVCTHPNVTDYTSCSDTDLNVCTASYCITGTCSNTNVADGTSCTSGPTSSASCYSGTCEVCGDGIRGHYEECDNGNSSGCTSNCIVNLGWSCSGDVGSPSVCTDNCAYGNTCTDTDLNECTTATCDNNHTCNQAAGTSSGTSCTDDGEYCTYDQCNGAGTCAHTNYLDDGTSCPTVVNGHCYGGVCQNTCGDGITQPFYEDCDLGSGTNGTPSACCDSTCHYVTVGTECRASSGVCDVAETCTGSAGSCPSDSVASNSSLCRASTGQCDSDEYCDGISTACPAESYSYNSSSCTGDAYECTSDYCDNNVCIHPNVADFTACTDNDANACTASYCITGTCSNTNVADGTSCTGGASSASCYSGTCEVCGDGVRGHYEDCDNGNSSGCSTNCTVDTGWSCTGNVGSPSVCTDNCVNGATCTDTDLNECTTATCNGSHTCDQTVGTTVGTSCTDDGEYCTYDECDGSGNCTHALGYADGTSCPTVVNGHCYNLVCQDTCGDSSVQAWEQCDQGVSNGTADSCCDSTCQYVTLGTQCRAATGTCDVAETCTGSAGTCPSDTVASNSSVCRTSTGECDGAEYCDGITTTCPADGTGATSSTCTDDGNQCTADLCSANACGHTNVADFTSCTEFDSNECTTAGCMSGSCTELSVVDGTACTSGSCYTGTCEVCGDGVRGHYEDCDNGNSSGCSVNCTVDAGWSCTGNVGSPSVCTDNCAPGNSCTDTDLNECTAATCNGSHVCDQNAATSIGTSCTDDGEYCTYDQCNGAGACVHTSLVADGTSCPAVVNGHCYTGVCQNTCGDSTIQSWEQCDQGMSNGSADSCCDSTCQYVTLGTQCRASGGVCDVAETCTGSSGACPMDSYANASSACNPSSDGGVCDPTDYCDGLSSSCPSDSLGWMTTQGSSCPDGNTNDCYGASCYNGSCQSSSSSEANGTQCFENIYTGTGWCYGGTCYNCGNGTTDPGEECDAGANNSVFGYCCDAVCLYESAMTVCYNSVTGNQTCDPTLYCNGAGTCASSSAATSCSNASADDCNQGVCAAGNCSLSSVAGTCNGGLGLCGDNGMGGWSCIPIPF